MSILFALLAKLVPLYLFIGLGFLAGRFLKVQREAIATLLIYIIAPGVVFYGVYRADLSLVTLSIPFFFWVVCCLLALIFSRVGSYFFNDRTENVLGYTAGDGNTGYFGLPVALILFGDQVLGIAVLSLLGFLLFENTLGYYLMARSHHAVGETFAKLFRLPTLYAFFLGVIVHFSGFTFDTTFIAFFEQFKTSYSLLGMMMIGLGLATIVRSSFDFRFIGLAFFAKFIVWPVVIFGFIQADLQWFHWYDASMHNVMMLMAIVPLAANTVTFATQLKVHPEKAAIAVALSTLFALIYIPLVTSFLF